MEIKELIIRLNIISGNLAKLQKFKNEHNSKVKRLCYRGLLLFSDLFVGIPKMYSIIREMNCGNPNKTCSCCYS